MSTYHGHVTNLGSETVLPVDCEPEPTLIETFRSSVHVTGLAGEQEKGQVSETSSSALRVKELVRVGRDKFPISAP